jgi:hypothetical protein
VPSTNSTVPAGSIVSSARSRGAPVFSSIDAAIPMPRRRPRMRASLRRAAKPSQFCQHRGAPQRCGIVAAVVDQTERVPVWHRLRRDEVLVPQRQAVEPVAPARHVDQPLEHEHYFRPARAAIGRGRGGVGDDANPAHVRDRDAIHARRDRDSLRQRHEGDGARPEIAGVDRAQRKEVAVFVESELGLRREITAVKIGEERISSIAQPFNRAPGAFCRPRDQHKLGAGVIADAEIAANVTGDHAHRIFCDAERAGDIVPLADHAAAGAGIDAESRRCRIVRAKCCAQFHRYAGYTVYRRLQPHDMCRLRKGGFGRDPIACFRVDAQVRAALGLKRQCSRRQRVL